MGVVRVYIPKLPSLYLKTTPGPVNWKCTAQPLETFVLLRKHHNQSLGTKTFHKHQQNVKVTFFWQI